MAYGGGGRDGAGTLACRIGRRLRARRRELGLTLAETAERARLSVSYVSAVEKGTNLPSLQSLVKIADALQTTIPAVLVAEGTNRVRRGRLPGPGGGAADLGHRELQLKAIAVRSVPGEQSPLELPTKDHDVFCYCLEGEVEVVFDGHEPVTVGAGDALDVRSAVAISWSARSGALLVWTSCPIRV
ncbi:MAG: helix-turn-helix domain-containing protein [Acidimicrobiales bacterium]